MPDFAWNEGAGRFRDRSTGRFIPERKVRDGVDATIETATDRVVGMSQRLRSGSMDVLEFQTGFLREVKSVHIASSLAAYGGTDAMTPERWGFVGSRIKEQYQYARGMTQDIISGRQPMNGRLDVRVSMYMDAGRVTYETIRAREAQRRNPGQEERNVLHASESCRECTELTSRGYVPLGSLPPVGTRLCLVRCKCTIERRAVRRQTA